MKAGKRHAPFLFATVLTAYLLAAGYILTIVDRSAGQINDIRMMSMFELAVHSSLLRGETDLYLGALASGAETGARTRLSNRVATRVANISGLLARVRSFEGLDDAVISRVEALRDRLSLLRASDSLADPQSMERFRESVIVTVQALQHAAEETITLQTGALQTFAGWTRELTAILAGIGLIVVLLVYNLHMKNRQLLAVSNQDALTGMSTRRHAHQQGLLLARAARADNTPLTLAVIDIDHFKAVNDRFGHLVGDQVIRRVADLLEALPGAGKVAARMGGEEFVMLWPRTTAATATAYCRSLQTQLAALDADLIPLVTVSIGLASGYGADADFDQLYHNADEALYAAKHRGRNAIALYGDLIETVTHQDHDIVAGQMRQLHADNRAAGHKVA